MDTNTYLAAVRKVSRLHLLGFVGISIPLLAIVLLIIVLVSGGIYKTGGFIALGVAIPSACTVFIVGAIVVKRIDQKFGIRCPHCNRSLTHDCDRRAIAESGCCWHCGDQVLSVSNNSIDENVEPALPVRK